MCIKLWSITIIFILFIFGCFNCPNLVVEATVSLTPLAGSPIATSSGVYGSTQCTKNSDESYAVCGSYYSYAAIKFNLQPFSFAAKGPTQSNMRSCDLYETASQSTSRAVCVQTGVVVYFHYVSSMTIATSLSIAAAGSEACAIVDTPNQVAYVSDWGSAPRVYKITNIGSATPTFAGNLTSFGSGDSGSLVMRIVDGFLYLGFWMTPARLGRINIATFTWAQTVTFSSGEDLVMYDDVANDENFIYILTDNGIVVRCTYKNNNFARLDSLNTGWSSTYSLAITPDQTTLIVVSSGNSLLQMVNVSLFSTCGIAVSVPSAFGRPIITSWGKVYAFTGGNDNVYAFTFNQTVCPAGYYCPGTCSIPCPGGTNSSVTGANSSATCSTCPAGYYCPSGSANATACPAGYYCPSGSATPTTCSAGYYSSATGATSSATCSACPAGYYSSATGATSSATCSTCPGGYYCPSGCSWPIACLAGYYSSATGATSSATCSTCPAGTYCPSGSATPTACPAGYYCPSGCSWPNACPAGYFSSATGATSSATCSTCPAGYYCPSGSATATACPAGYYSSATGATSSATCSTCTLGSASNVVARTTACPSCVAGTYAAATGMTACTLCGYHKYSTAIGASSPNTCIWCGYRMRTYIQGASSLTQCYTRTFSVTSELTETGSLTGDRTVTISPSQVHTGSASISEAVTSSVSQTDDQSSTVTTTISQNSTSSVSLTVDQSSSVTKSISQDSTSSVSQTVDQSYSVTTSISQDSTSSVSQTVDQSSTVSTSISQVSSSSLSQTIDLPPTVTKSISQDSTSSVSQTVDQSSTVSTSISPDSTSSVSQTDDQSSSVSTSISQNSTSSVSQTVDQSSSVTTSISHVSSSSVSVTSSASNSISNSETPSSNATTSLTQSESTSTSLSASRSTSTTASASFSPSATESQSGSTSNSHSETPRESSTQSLPVTDTASMILSNSTSLSSTESVSSPATDSLSASKSFSRSTTVSSSTSNSATSTSSLSSSPSRTFTSSSSQSLTSSRSMSNSMSASQSSSISNSKSVTSSTSPSLTTSRSDTNIDCRRIWNQSHCNRDVAVCKWCENIRACIDESESCSAIHCKSFSAVATTIESNLCPSSECHYCSKSRTCLNKTEDPTCSCVVASSSLSSCNASGECFWCNTNISFFEQPPNSVNLCIDNNNKTSPESQECNCAFLPQHICNQTSSPCEWCDAVNSCIDPRIKKCEDTRCPDFTPIILSGQCPSQKCGVCKGICVGNEFVGENCNPSRFDETTCDGCHNCSWNLPIVLGVGDSNPYCVMSASPLNCESPPTCNGINSNEKEKRNQCESSGCKFDEGKNLCVNQQCFFFVLNGFVLQPFALTVFGFAKDIFVLLLIGVFGDSFMRFVRRRTLFINFWLKKWDRNRIIPNLDRTIYVNDSKCRDETSERNESFEKYCERIISELFELPTSPDQETDKSSNNKKGVANTISEFNEDDEKGDDKMWKLNSKVLDAVTFSMYDSGLWFDLDDDGFSRVRDAPILLTAFLDLILDQAEDEEAKEQEIKSDFLLVVEQKPTESETLAAVKESKVPLCEKLIGNRLQLQETVNQAIAARATAVVFYASSRDPATRAASALNSFPSLLQLVFYNAGVLALVLSALYTTVINEKNVDTIRRISRYSCGASIDATNSTAGSTFSADSRTTLFLIGFRLVNASTLATVMLLLVKTVRAVWSSFGDRFYYLNLPQRLPIMSLYTKRPAQILVAFYFTVVFPFTFVGVTYGLGVSGSLIVCLIAIAVLVLDVSILSAIRFITKKIEKEEFVEAKRKFMEEERELSLILGVNSKFSSPGANHNVTEYSNGGDDASTHWSRVDSSSHVNDNDNNNNMLDDVLLGNNIENVQENESPTRKRGASCAILAAPKSIKKRRRRHGASMIRRLYGRIDVRTVEANTCNNNTETEEWDEITAQEALTAKKSSLTNAAPNTLAKALLVFFLSEELPTVVLTLALQMCFNYMCLMEYKSSFGINDASEVPQLEYSSRKLQCVIDLFVNDASGIINGVSSFIAYF